MIADVATERRRDSTAALWGSGKTDAGEGPAIMYSKDMIFFYVINPTLQTFYVLVIVFCYANMAKNH